MKTLKTQHKQAFTHENIVYVDYFFVCEMQFVTLGKAIYVVHSSYGTRNSMYINRKSIPACVLHMCVHDVEYQYQNLIRIFTNKLQYMITY